MPVATKKISENDPFAHFLRPPVGETPIERAERLQREAEAARISAEIDEAISKDRAQQKKDKDLIKVLLLGQSESGKSTTLKNLRMAYAKEEWLREKASWRAVIQLNLIRSISVILETLRAEIEDTPYVDEPDPQSETPNQVVGQQSPDFALASPVSPVSTNSGSSGSSGASEAYDPRIIQEELALRKRDVEEKYHDLRDQLSRLKAVEMDLKRVLGAGTEEVTSMEMDDEKTEVFVRPWKWREVLRGSGPKRQGDMGNDMVAMRQEDIAALEATRAIASCRNYMQLLWNDEGVRLVLVKRNIRLEETAGFFLDDIERIATLDYEPSDDDIVRARLRTVGVQEYRVSFGRGLTKDPMSDWIFYDVGGSRTVRHAWVPYFDDINSIIFLAPISAFPDRLLEDPSVNRLQDTFTIWKTIVSSRLLAKTTLVCFLNKCDLLKRKLRSGIMFRDYVPPFGNRANDTATVVRFLKDWFRDVVLKHSADPKRTCYLYPTSVTDTKATATTLKTVRDSIVRENMMNARLI
ncbi:putative g-protein alpha subunit [Moniliophthora roreri MCA 2997]|uniref:G-protein alpha subunit n=1 Tax=Moniliophthora roreri (strain MCA 2997) TaxID=1381753 RepID=V2YBM5_MONRO|nr:putative g-protein alpha subunit [Moniliophthora roreri MCA 2997]